MSSQWILAPKLDSGEGGTSTPAVDLLFAFTGRPLDRDTGLQNNLHRWYEPTNGRWLSEDPNGFDAGDANLYRYVGNGVTNATDPSGLQPPLPTSGPWQVPLDAYRRLPPPSHPGPNAFWEGQWFGPKAGSFVDNTKWLENRFPKTVQAMRDGFDSKLRKAIEHAVNEGQRKNPIRIQIPGGVLVGPSTKALHWSNFGDADESPNDASYFGLGHVTFGLTNVEVEITEECHGDFTYRYWAKLKLFDELGIQNRDGIPIREPFKPWFPSRIIYRGLWDVNGQGTIGNPDLR